MRGDVLLGVRVVSDASPLPADPLGRVPSVAEKAAA
jgi:hypothetical protein